MGRLELCARKQHLRFQCYSTVQFAALHVGVAMHAPLLALIMPCPVCTHPPGHPTPQAPFPSVPSELLNPFHCRTQVQRLMEALQYGSGLDYTYHKPTPDSEGCQHQNNLQAKP